MYNIIVVGCGATGSNLVALLSQYAINEKKINEITLIDGDMVEAKNFRNQKYTEKDINKNKAKVLANRYSKLGIEISYIDKYISSQYELIDVIKKSKYDVILIGCVDNILARRYMHYAFIDNSIRNIVYIDTGNGDVLREGQTVTGIKSNYKIIKPPVAEIFPEILNAEVPEEENKEYKCSAVDEHPQNMAVNVMSATVVFGILTNIITFNTCDNNVLRFNLSKMYLK